MIGASAEALPTAARIWARVRSVGAHGLRRGAWYPVVNSGKSDLILLNVHRSNVPVPRAFVELSELKPYHWSVVEWMEGDRGAGRATQENDGLTYGVCPSCRFRAPIAGRPEQITCPECQTAAEVDWAHPC